MKTPDIEKDYWPMSKIPPNVRENWKVLTESISQLLEVPLCIIMSSTTRFLKVVASSNSFPDQLFYIDKEKFYSCKVAQSKKRLIIENALEDECWKDFKNLKMGYISYLGIPLLLPNSSLFGVLCVQDRQKRKFSLDEVKILDQFGAIIETQLGTLFRDKDKVEKSRAKETGPQKDKKLINYIESPPQKTEKKGSPEISLDLSTHKKSLEVLNKKKKERVKSHLKKTNKENLPGSKSYIPDEFPPDSFEGENLNAFINGPKFCLDCGKQNPPEARFCAKCQSNLVKARRMLLRKASKFLDERRVDKAVEYLDKVLKMNPQDIEALFKKGVALKNLGKLEESIRCFDEILKIHPNDTSSLHKKGSTLLGMGKALKAIRCYQKILKIDPGDSEALSNLKLASSLYRVKGKKKGI